MGLATVYRNLRQLQRQGKVRCRHLPTVKPSMRQWSVTIITSPVWTAARQNVLSNARSMA